MESYYAQLLEGQLPVASEHGSDELLPRLLEIADIISGDDGEAYAHQLKSILKAVEGDEPANKCPVLQDAVEELLIRIHARGCPIYASLVSIFTAPYRGQLVEERVHRRAVRHSCGSGRRGWT